MTDMWPRNKPQKLEGIEWLIGFTPMAEAGSVDPAVALANAVVWASAAGVD